MSFSLDIDYQKYAKLFRQVSSQVVAEKNCNDLILMSTTAAGLQTQLNALASFCDQRQLTVNLSKTKVVVFEPRRSDVADFVLNGAVVERGESYKYLGFVFHATKNMSVGTSFLVAAARKAMFAMRRRCAEVGIRDPALQCKLFDTIAPGPWCCPS